MLLRVAASASLLVSIACTKEPAPMKRDASVSSSPRASKRPPPADGPCAADADCSVYLEPCSCGCLPYIAATSPSIPNDEWATVCGGGPPGNCGVASPCMNRAATCDAATKKCVLFKK